MTSIETLRQCRRRLTATLRTVSGDEAELEAVLLLQAATGIDRLHQLTDPDRPLSPAEAAQLAAWLADRLRHRPLSQILGGCEFFGLGLAVTADVLCPRPETELLVETVLAHVPPEAEALVVDLGTGSGAIALALASQRPAWHLIGIDRSPEALAVARRNGERLGLAVDWRLGDWIAPLADTETGCCRAIVSNPPYIPEATWRALAPEVRDHEPKGALVGGEDGLAPYDVLPGLVWPYLCPGGLFAVEVGQGQAEAVQERLAAAGYQRLAIGQDLAGIGRVVSGFRA